MLYTIDEAVEDLDGKQIDSLRRIVKEHEEECLVLFAEDTEIIKKHHVPKDIKYIIIMRGRYCSEELERMAERILYPHQVLKATSIILTANIDIPENHVYGYIPLREDLLDLKEVFLVEVQNIGHPVDPLKRGCHIQ